MTYLNLPTRAKSNIRFDEKYNVWKLKKMYGREYMGVERSTFLLNPEGKIAELWRKVRVKGHVDSVKQRLAEFQG